MLDLNPVTTALVQLTQGGMEPPPGNLVNSRLRYFRPAGSGRIARGRGACLGMPDTGTVVTLVNLNDNAANTGRTGRVRRARDRSVDVNGKTIAVGKPNFSVTLET